MSLSHSICEVRSMRVRPMKSAQFLSWVVVAVLLSGSGNVCRAEGWSFPSLWPFAKKKTDATQAPVKTASWPKLSIKPAWPLTRKEKDTNGPSTFDRIAAGSKKAWSDTKKMVTPGSISLHRPSKLNRPSQAKAKSPKKPSMFSRLFKRAPQDTGSRTTQEFLSQERYPFAHSDTERL